MAEICCKVMSESEASSSCEPSSRVARRRRMEIRRCKFVARVDPTETETVAKRQKLEDRATSISRDCDNAVQNCDSGEEETVGRFVAGEVSTKEVSAPLSRESPCEVVVPKFGLSSVCGRRREMEDAVAVHPSLCFTEKKANDMLHFFGVYDGHGCSHVAMRCKERLHELVKDELDREEMEDAAGAAETEAETASRWDRTMKRVFRRMDNEVVARNNEEVVVANCRCELQSPDCDAVGSTAVVAIVTPDKIIVANCGDSRAVLCRNGKAIPLSSDHKPDRPDELSRIEEAGGRVIYWDGPRVLGVLAMSRAIGDNYLKPYVISEPEVTITNRTAEDECLILGSDGLWDVVPNETACGVASMCLRGKADERSALSPSREAETAVEGEERGKREKSKGKKSEKKLTMEMSKNTVGFFKWKVMIMIVLLLGTSISANNMVDANAMEVEEGNGIFMLPRKMMKNGLLIFQYGVCPLIYMPCKQDSDCLKDCVCKQTGICGGKYW